MTHETTLGVAGGEPFDAGPASGAFTNALDRMQLVATHDRAYTTDTTSRTDGVVGQNFHPSVPSARLRVRKAP